MPYALCLMPYASGQGRPLISDGIRPYALRLMPYALCLMPQVKPGLSSLMKDGKAAAVKDEDLHALPDIQLRTAAQQAAASLQALFFF